MSKLQFLGNLTEDIPATVIGIFQNNDFHSTQILIIHLSLMIHILLLQIVNVFISDFI